MASIFDSYVTDVTQDFIMPKLADLVLDNNVLLSRLIGKAEMWRGEQLKANIRVGSSNASAALGGSFRGTDTFNTQRQDETKQMAFNPKYVYEPVNLVHTDLTTNTGKEQVTSIIKRDTEYAFSNLLDNIGSMLYGSATDSSGT